MKIWLEDRTRRSRPEWARLRRKVPLWVRRILIRMDRTGVEVGVRLTGDREMGILNRRYRGKNRPTDVLAFAMQEGPPLPGPRRDRVLLGDMVVSVQTAARQAARRGHSLEREMAILVIHGMLHLMGYDHERSAAAARKMAAKERGLRRHLEKTGPPRQRIPK